MQYPRDAGSLMTSLGLSRLTLKSAAGHMTPSGGGGGADIDTGSILHGLCI